MSKQAKLKPAKPADRADQRANVAIKKQIAGTPYFFGRERSRRSRKYRHKLLTKIPVNLAALVAKPPAEKDPS